MNRISEKEKSALECQYKRLSRTESESLRIERERTASLQKSLHRKSVTSKRQLEEAGNTIAILRQEKRSVLLFVVDTNKHTECLCVCMCVVVVVNRAIQSEKVILKRKNSVLARDSAELADIKHKVQQKRFVCMSVNAFSGCCMRPNPLVLINV